MEAPAKTGGSRKQRNGRDLISRLTTLPPIQFLKRHNPLRRRRKLKLGFDQPPHEIQELALPLRTTPPPWRRRAKLWMGKQWLKAAVVTGRVAGKTQRARQAVRSTLEHLNARLVERVAAVKDSRAARWCAARVRIVTHRLAALAPASWEPTQAPVLMARVQRVRRALASVAVCEWTATVGLCGTLAVLAVRGHTWDSRAINLCGVMLCAVSLAGLALHAWSQRLIASWRSLDLFMCGQCGELRNFSPSRPCSRCGNEAVPVFPGQLPETWTRWTLALSAPALSLPPILSALLLFSSRIL